MKTIPIPPLTAPKPFASKTLPATLIIPISDLNDESGETYLEKQLSGLPGLLSAEANFLHKHVKVTFIPEQIALCSLIQHIRSTGYEPEVVTEKFRIEGMHCASCVARVEKSIRSIPNVISASALLNDSSVLIEYIPSFDILPALEKAVRNAGYTLIRTASFTDDPTELLYKKHDRQLMVKTIVALTFTIPVAVLSMTQPEITSLHYLLLILTLPVVLYSGKNFYITAFRMAIQKTAGMDTLVAIGTGTAFLYSLAVTIFPDWFSSSGQGTHVYYETTAVIITLILTGRFLEARAKRKTTEAVRALARLQPSQATIIRLSEINGQMMETEETVAVAQIRSGDILIVRPGEKIAADGQVLRGTASVDESMLTGESMPVRKAPDDKVLAGTINLDGMLIFRAEQTGEQTTWAQIVRLVQRAQASKPPIQKFVDRISAVFVPVVLLIALITFILWIMLASDAGLAQAITHALTVLIVACPCALGLATPTAITVAIGRSAAKGILIQNAESLEALTRVNRFAFDKTGTLTAGKPEVKNAIRYHPFNDSHVQAEALILSAVRQSSHPLAKAIIRYLRNTSDAHPALPVETFHNFPGLGFTAQIAGYTIHIGNRQWMQEQKIPLPENEPMNPDMTPVYAAAGGQLCMIFLLQDSLRSEARTVVAELNQMGIEPLLLSGDTERSVAAVALETGIRRYYASLLPDQKQSLIRNEQKKGHIVSMIGDGINDAPALTQADVGIAVHSGSDIARESADILLMKNDLKSIPVLIRLAEHTKQTIRQNLFWAFIYNITGIPVAAGVLIPAFSIGFDPMIAAAMMTLSSVSVITNSLRIKVY